MEVFEVEGEKMDKRDRRQRYSKTTRRRKGGGGGILELEATGLLTQDSEPGVTTLVYSHNGFNDLIRLAILLTVRHRWPSGERFMFNCCRRWAHILLR